MNDFPAIGIDVGGGSTKIGLVAPDGTVLGQCSVASDVRLSGVDLLDQYIAAAEALQREAGIHKLAGIGIGLPGHIDLEAGTTQVGNVGCLNGFPIVQHVSAKTGLAVAIENDATLAALAEFRFGVGRGSRRFMAVTLGTGIGVGFIVDGRAIHTANGTLADIGHVIVDPLGEKTCRQGCRGCLESVASGLALDEQLVEIVSRHPDCVAARLSGTLDGLRLLFECAKRAEPHCERIVNDAARFIAAGVVSWAHIFAPDRIAFAGGMAVGGGSPFVKSIASFARSFAMPGYLTHTDLLPAALSSTAGIIGAAALCLDQIPPREAKS